MSPRAAWRLETLGYRDVYDYVASKMDWLGAGLPFEGTLAAKARLGTLADPQVPTCRLEETVEGVAERLGSWELCLVVNDEGVVLGLVRAEALSMGGGQRVQDVMREAPKTFRPHVTAEEFAPQLDKSPRPWVLVTNLDGTLVGVARPEEIHAAAQREKEAGG
jgi:Mg/Co/Ni transporter MgtE